MRMRMRTMRMGMERVENEHARCSTRRRGGKDALTLC